MRRHRLSEQFKRSRFGTDDFRRTLLMPIRPAGILYWLGMLVNLFQGWRFSGEMADEPKLILALAPHTTNWDFFVGVPLMLAIRARVSIMMKQEAFFFPFKSLLISSGFVPVNRTEAAGMVGAAVREFNQREKFWLVITPEGTRSRGKQWKNGFLRIAEKADVPIQLLAIDYPSKTLRFGPVIQHTDDNQADIERCKAYFSDFSGRY